MAYNKNDVELNEENVAAFLADVVKKVEASPDEYSSLRKIFKQSVHLGRRSYVAAYLIKALMSQENGRSRFGRRNERSFVKENRISSHFDNAQNVEKTERTERAERPARPERAPRVQIDESLATTIFVGIGRNRRVYPRDLVGLLVSVANISRDRIGDIRVLANYSFIQLFTEDCEKAISSLNGYDYRGRKLSVSYSKLNNVDEAEKSEGMEDSAVVNDSVTTSSASENASSSYLV